MQYGIDALKKLQEETTLSGVLLDWDGCCVAKGAPQHLEVFRRAAKKFGYQFSDKEAYQIYVGPKHGIDWYLLMREGLSDLSNSEFLEFRDTVREEASALAEEAQAPLALLNGMQEFLEYCRETFGQEKVVVTTATPTEIAKAMIVAANVQHCVNERVFGCDEMWTDGDNIEAICTKRERRVWSRPAEFAGFELSEALLVEDGSDGTHFALNSEELAAFCYLGGSDLAEAKKARVLQASIAGEFYSVHL